MRLTKLIAAAVAALAFAPFSQAAFVTLNEAGMDGVFSQASFGQVPIDIRYGPLTQLVRPDLLDISTPGRLNDLFNQHVGAQDVVNFYYVDTIEECGGFNVNIIGCGETPGQDFVVESIWAADTTIQPGGISFGVQLLAHELGHNLGLQHRNGDFLMNPSINGFQALNAAEVAIIRASPLVHQDARGFFIQINPVLIVSAAAVPEPTSIALVMAGLLAAGAQARRRKSAS